VLSAKAAGAFSSHAPVGSQRSFPGNCGRIDVDLQGEFLHQGTFTYIACTNNTQNHKIADEGRET